MTKRHDPYVSLRNRNFRWYVTLLGLSWGRAFVAGTDLLFGFVRVRPRSSAAN